MNEYLNDFYRDLLHQSMEFVLWGWRAHNTLETSEIGPYAIILREALKDETN